MENSGMTNDTTTNFFITEIKQEEFKTGTG
jgi:hypothetical protein